MFDIKGGIINNLHTAYKDKLEVTPWRD